MNSSIVSWHLNDITWVEGFSILTWGDYDNLDPLVFSLGPMVLILDYIVTSVVDPDSDSECWSVSKGIKGKGKAEFNKQKSLSFSQEVIFLKRAYSKV